MSDLRPSWPLVISRVESIIVMTMMIQDYIYYAMISLTECSKAVLNIGGISIKMHFINVLQKASAKPTSSAFTGGKAVESSLKTFYKEFRKVRKCL